MVWSIFLLEYIEPLVVKVTRYFMKLTHMFWPKVDLIIRQLVQPLFFTDNNECLN